MGYKLPQINWKLPIQYYKFKLLKLKPNEQTFEWIGMVGMVGINEWIRTKSVNDYRNESQSVNIA